MLRKILAEIVPGQIRVVADTEIALEAAFGQGPGVIVIAGTGSIAYGRDENGKTARAGGWGFAISDEGSAHWTGRLAVAAILRATDMTGGAAEDVLRQDFVAALCRPWGVSSVADLARAANSIPPPDFAALFPAVAASKDVLALELQSSAGKELARLAAIVTRRLFVPYSVTNVPVAMVGGVFRHSIRAKSDFYNELRNLDPRAEINPQIVEPFYGALEIARRAAT